MIRKIIFTNYFSEFVQQSRHKIQVPKDLAKVEFSVRHYTKTLSQNDADKVLKTPDEVYDIYIIVCEVLLSKLYNQY